MCDEQYGEDTIYLSEIIEEYKIMFNIDKSYYADLEKAYDLYNQGKNMESLEIFNLIYIETKDNLVLENIKHIESL